MKKLFTVFGILCLLPGSLLAQLLTVAPADFSLEDEITITYNASLGNKGLAGYQGDVYAHTGVITGGGSGLSDWKYVQGSWGQADPRLKMKVLANDQYQISFVPREFYDLPENELVEKLAFVFRNADGTKVGKDSEGNDLFIDVPRQIEENIELTDKRYQSHSLQGNELRVQTDQGAIIIRAYDRGITKVSFNTSLHQPADSSFSVILNPQEVAVDLVEQEEYLLYDAPYLDVFIQKAPFKLKFIAQGDTVVSEEAGFYEQNETLGARFELKKQEALYGSGSRAIPHNRRGKNLKIYNEAHYGYTAGAPVLNVTIPFIVSSKGYGILFDNYHAGQLDAGAKSANVMDWRFQGGAASYYVIAEESYSALMNSYTKLTGKQPLPPLWALGFIQSKYGYKTEQEAREIVQQLQEDDFPIDALVLDLYWFGMEGDMGRIDWDRTNWPTPEAMMEDLQEKGVKTIVIAEPYFTQQSGNFDVLAGKGLLATNEAGEPYLIKDFWAGSAGLIDMTNPEAWDWMWEFYRKRIEEGVSGWWSDLGEPENHPAGMRHAMGEPYEVHNIYSLLWAKFIYENYRRDFPEQRVFNLIRSGYTGMQRYATFPWSGDIQRSWSGLQTQVPIMLGMSMSGVGYIHSDLGGFTGGGVQPELYARWLQMGAFVPVMRAHGAGGIPPEPVFYDDPYKSIVRDYIKLRYSLMPYLYTMAWKNTEEGLPLVKPMNFYDPANTLLKEVDDQYFWGESFIVAPVMKEGQQERAVVLPKGRWINYWTNKAYNGNSSVNVEAPLAQLPLFVRAGSFIPSIRPVSSLSDLRTDTLQVNYYPDAGLLTSSYTMYLDDGHTPDPENYQLIRFEGIQGESLTEVRLFKEGPGFEGAPENRFIQFKLPRVSGVPAKIRLNGQEVPMLATKEEVAGQEGAFYDGEEKVLFISFSWGGSEALLSIEQLTVAIDGETMEGSQKGFNLHAPYINPAAEEEGVVLGYDVVRPGQYTLEISDPNGRLVYIKTFRKTSGGRGKEVWNRRGASGEDLLPGTYEVRMKSRQGSEIRELLIK